MTPPELDSRRATPTTPAERRAYDDVLHCNRCGFCTSFCPTYLATGEESLSPRGRNQTWRALMEGRLDPADGKRAFDTCLLCGICTSVCFAQVPTASLMSGARETVQNALGPPRLARFVLRWLLPRPAWYERTLKILFWGKRLGLSGLLNRAGVLGLIHPRLAAAEKLVDRAPRRFVRDDAPPATPAVEVVHFLACGPNCLTPEVGRATEALLKVRGVAFGAADNVCCGLPGVSFGDREAARRLARLNIERLERYPAAIILVDDSSCAATVKDWPSFFTDDPPWKSRADAVARRTRDLLEWLNVPPVDGRSAAGSAVSSAGSEAVTYHDACKARYAQGLVDEPRRLLKQAPGVDYRELPEADQCCGGAGTYQFMQPDISAAVGDRKVKNIIATGAAVVLTSSVSCLLQLRAGLRRAGTGPAARHIAEWWADRAVDKKSDMK